MPRLSRVLTAVAALLLIGMFVFPLWRITLQAPQYPEGLGMLIRLNTVTGVGPNDLANINGLNHYIGMQLIVPESIPELRFMPWIVGALVITGLAVAAIGRRGLLAAWLGTYLLLGVAGLVDFWKWEYDYGHNLAPDAPIKVPGMAYQPPLIGPKQLLNFTAYSWPDVGAILAGLAFVVGAVALWLAWRAPRATAAPAVPTAPATARARAAASTHAVAGR